MAMMPKRTKYRSRAPRTHPRPRDQRGNTRGSFGDYGLQSLDAAWVTGRQIEASRVSRRTARWAVGGKIWIRVFPHKPDLRQAGRDPHG